MRLALLVSALAACGGAAKPSTGPANTSSTSASTPPSAYAAVFAPANLSFEGEVRVTESTDTGPVTTRQALAVTCTIGDVDTKAEYSVATLRCTATPESFPQDPSGTLVGTPTGLYHVDSFDGDLTKLDDKHRLLPAEPEKDKREWPGEEEGFGEAMIVDPHAGGWCASHAMWGGDEGGWTLCFHPDKGLVGGASFWAGGMSKDVYFGDVPRP